VTLVMSLHKLTAGDGYTYLTRQVAAADATERGFSSLGDYYSAKGEAPGVWMGGGLETLGVSGAVTEAQMKNLFGQGIHPDAERVAAASIAAGQSVPVAQAAGRLGAKFPVFEIDPAWHDELAAAYRAYNSGHDQQPEGVIAPDAREQVRTEVANRLFERQHGRAPASLAERSGFIAQQSRPDRTAVAGYDVTFSPVKSVSALWAVAPTEVSEQIEAAHRAAVEKTVAWIEKEAGYTRVGVRSVGQVRTRGLVMAAFTHRDSRAGDPDLHTHVAISNKVQRVDGYGQWQALDGRMLYRITVGASEFYNTQLEVEVTGRVGAVFADRTVEAGKRPVREIVGVDERLNAAWSTRRSAITTARTELTKTFLSQHGRIPTTVEMIKLSQRAALATREAKHEPRSLGEQREVWHAQAAAVLGGETGLGRMLAAVTDQQPDQAAPVTQALVTALAAATVETVAGSRATWRETNLDAEARRKVRYTGVHPNLMQHLAEKVAARAAGSEHSVRIGMDTEVAAAVPVELTRGDGQSIFRMAKGQLYTSPAILAAEARVVAAAGRLGGRVIEAGDVRIAQLEWSANNGGAVLNTAQAAMVTDIATNPAMVQLALAPAGTGKTTVMGVLARAWMSTGGQVVGLAPQASAAKELAAAIPGVEADTIDKLLHDVACTPRDRWLPWMRRIDADSLVVIDEAGLASTPKLDAAILFVTGRGGRVLLVGDDQQRAAAGAGGVLRDIESACGAVTLTEVLRFTDPQDGRASLALRAGDPSVVGHWADQDRIEAVTPDTAAGQVYRAWAADIAAGADSIMIAPTLSMVTTLNEQARAARLAAQVGDVGPETRLPNGETVSAGDVIITKQNKRNLSLGGTDFVRNNHRWTVQQVHPDGALTATEITRGVTRIIPAWYVNSGWVRLGYAHTHASVQGMTVGKAGVRRGTAHAVIVAGMTRNELYPALTRATDGTRSYVVLGGEGDSHDVTTPGAIEPPTAVDVLVKIVETDGGARSVTTEQREAADPARRLGQAADAYTHSIVVGAETVIGTPLLTLIITDAQATFPGIAETPAWEALRGHLVVLAAGGADPIEALTAAAAYRELGTARDISAVLDYRLDPSGNHSQISGPLPWLPAVPQTLAELPTWNTYLDARAELVSDLAGRIRAQAAGWDARTAPTWALPYLPDPGLVADLAVWRAAESVPETDPRPAGPAPRRIAMIRRHADLIRAALVVGGDARDGADRWADVLHHQGVHIAGDDYWPVLAARLSLADAAGINVPALLGAATTAPLPAEGPAGALWWRLAPHIGDLAAVPHTNGHKLRPPWTGALEEVLGERAVQRITGDRLWPVVVARVDQAARDGQNAHALVTDAAWMLAGHSAGLAEHELSTILMWNVDILTSTEPADIDVDEAMDPQNADRVAPDDAHQDLPDPVAARAEPESDGPEGTVDPFDADRFTAPAESVLDLVEPDDPAPDWPEDIPPADAAAVLPAPAREWAPLTEPVPDDQRWPVDLRELETRPDDELAASVGRSREALTAAQAFFTGKATGSWVPGYLASRGLDPAAAGYAPGRTTLVDHLRDEGFSDQEMLAAGLARHSDRGGVYDFFRNRLTLPYTDPDGQVVGFMTRKPPGDTNDRNPKYLNSPESELFHKRVLPFGLDPAAVAALRRGADVVLVEGPMDAMAVNTATGRRGLVAVATGGTALTADHLATLDGIAPLAGRQVLVVMDNDPAGDTAAVAARAVLTKAGIDQPATVVPLPVKDAAQLLQDHGPEALRAAMTDRRPLEDLVVDRIHNIHSAHRPQDIGRIEARLGVLDSAAPHVAAMTAEQQHRQALRLAEKLNLSTFTVLDRIDEHRPTPAPRPWAAAGDLRLPTPPVLSSRGDEPVQPEPSRPHLPEQAGTLALLDEPIPTPAVEPAAPEHSAAAAAPASVTVTVTPEPDDAAAAAMTVAAESDTGTAEPAVPDRQYQDLTGADLSRAARAAAAEAQQATQAAAQAQADALTTVEAVTAGHGPATEKFQQDTAHHEQYLADVATFQTHLQALREVQAQHHEAAGDLYDARIELARLGKLAGRRKAELGERIQQIQAEQAARLEHIATTADAVSPLQHRLGANPLQAQQRIDAAHAHLAGREELEAQAAEQDQQLADQTVQRAEALTAAADQAADNAARYAAEQQHRSDHAEAAVPDQPAAPAIPQATEGPGFGPDDEEYDLALDWTYRPEIHDEPPTLDHGIER